jgi:anti-sigma B factor antagonist
VCPIKPLEIDTRVEGAVTLMSLSGHIATAESQVLSDAFDRLISDRIQRIVVDMKGVEIITSDGLGALIRARKAVAENGGRLVLSGLEGNIRSVFKMTRLDKIFTLYDTVPSAVAALGE